MVPVLIMNAILIAIAILLLIAEKFLVTYGECKISVEQDGNKEITVQGGEYLLSYLNQHNIEISSSCGGKASCGYCKVKVLNGGGPILPTEEIYMSREEKANGMRLACQVKVRNDLIIEIPDFLVTVRGMVKNHNYNAAQKWNFNISKQTTGTLAPANMSKLSAADEATMHGIIKEYKDKEGVLVPVLQKSSDAFHYLSEPVLHYISTNLKVPLSTVFRVVTFYNAFSLKPRGKYVITICLGTACHVKGAGDILDTFERELGIKNGETTSDRLFSLEGVRCIGCCGLAPVLKINEDVHGLMTRKKVADLIKKYREAPIYGEIKH